ncbi:NucA/NucB deoxyribonuclease domain-containing protein [Streptomyces sp. enrichment culture]|uniref:NucA/NucB deoxyribonuclease domain-containing protein n=1 Tax=Streptomyces sp. enrichment culture TaxID=1795815 RepID=UPI003F573C81
MTAAAAVLPMAAPSTAGADTTADLRVESYVLPAGAAKPSLEELRSAEGRERLRRTATAAEPGAVLAQETVGPAASSAPLSRRPSGSPPADATTRAQPRTALGPTATAPEPARTMTYDECVKGLGSDKKFYVKSRFAVCNGASFLQTWTRNGQPVGTSMFNVRAVGTIAKNSRTITFQYYFTDFATAGTTGASAMPITTKADIPQSWPSGARYTRGGTMPGTKTFTQLKALRTSKETVTAKPGQGSGSADLLFAVYEPAISYTPPAPWKLSGALGGKLFMLAPRWDAASYLANSTGGGTPAKKGAATFSYITPLTLSAKQGAEERAEAAHIRQAFLTPLDTKPYMSAKKVPGQTAKEPLHRTVSAARIDKNRAAAVKQCKRYWGANYTQGGTLECDEYPFASTYEGAAEPEFDADAKKFNFSAKPIAKDDNQAGGSILKSYYAKNRIIDGMDDGFIVKIVT